MSDIKNKKYTYQELSAFCLQISMLLNAAVPLDEGLSIMSQDAKDEGEKKMLLSMAEGSELGLPFFQVLEETGAFPPYVIRMARLGQETGTLDEMMSSLADYYDKEHHLLRNIKNAVTYPIIMVFMLFAVLFVLFVKVMPIFENVYQQLGAQISPAAQSAIHMGGIFSGAALVAGVVLVLVTAVVYLMSSMGMKVPIAEKAVRFVKGRSKIAAAVAKRRLSSVMSLAIRCGMEMEKGLEMAADLVENEGIQAKIMTCRDLMETGSDCYQSMKEAELFSGFHIQMIQVGQRSGHLDMVMGEISESYREQADEAIDGILARFEPTLVAILAVAVGFILLSVMLPLVGILAAIG
ncbi:type II secretion system F family protein [Lachnospiraceae bacterium 62-35]